MCIFKKCNREILYATVKKLLREYKSIKGFNSESVIKGKNGNRICSNSLQNAIRRIYMNSGIYKVWPYNPQLKTYICGDSKKTRI